jgi:hypothetical protein
MPPPEPDASKNQGKTGDYFDFQDKEAGRPFEFDSKQLKFATVTGDVIASGERPDA